MPIAAGKVCTITSSFSSVTVRAAVQNVEAVVERLQLHVRGADPAGRPVRAHRQPHAQPVSAVLLHEEGEGRARRASGLPNSETAAPSGAS